jgi:heme/copper-type cytochrome/quinol oxidase subunit 1
MRAYVITSGSIFGLLAVVHILRVFAEGRQVLADPIFVFVTLVAAALSGWAFRILQASGR